MSNTEMNRQIVQEGLDNKKTARRQRMNDAAHDAAERRLREVINRQAQERRAEIEAAQAQERRRKARKAQEAREVNYLYDCVLHVFGSMIFAALAALGFTHGAVNGWVAFPVVGLATVYSATTLVKYISRCLKRAAA